MPQPANHTDNVTVEHAPLPPSFYLLLRGEEVTPTHPVDQPMRIVLLHGFFQSHTCWLTTAFRLRNRYGHSILLLDFYGHGRSPYLKNYKHFDIRTFVAQLDQVMAQIGWKDQKVAIAGISMGGAVAQQYLLSHPNQVERILLLASAGLSEPKWNSVTPYFGKMVRAFLSMVHTVNDHVDIQWLINKKPVNALLCKLHLAKDTPTYGLDQEAIETALKRYPTTIIWPKYDFLHTPQLRRFKEGRDEDNLKIKIVPWMEHVMFCLTIDMLKLHRYPDFWHSKPISKL